MKKIIFLTMFLLSLNTSASLVKNVGCFSSDSNNINVKFVSIEDDGAFLGYVKYKKSQHSIPLIFLHEKEEEVGENRLHEKTTTWLEVINGKIHGQYEIMSQGARYYRFTYTNNEGESVFLNENLKAYNSSHSDCIWN